MKTSILYFGNNLTRYGKTPTGIDFIGDALSDHFLVIKYSHQKNKLLRLIHMIWGLATNAKKAQYALIDTYSTWGFYFAVTIATACRVLKVPYITILHGGNLPHRFKSSPFLSKLLLSHAYKLVAPSPYLQTQIADLGYETIHIPNLIDLSEYCYSPKSKLRPRLIWIRSLKNIYNPQMAVRVLAQLRKNYHDATLCMVGPALDDSMEKCIALAKELELNGEVSFTGMLTKQALRQTAAKQDIFINTTNVDNTPMTVIEAMAMGIPVISTNVGGIPYLVEKDKEALLTSPNDHHEMANQVEQLINDPGLAARITHAANKKAQLFDKKQVINQWLVILKKQ